jgi:hypothetical protein
MRSATAGFQIFTLTSSSEADSSSRHRVTCRFSWFRASIGFRLSKTRRFPSRTIRLLTQAVSGPVGRLASPRGNGICRGRYRFPFNAECLLAAFAFPSSTRATLQHSVVPDPGYIKNVLYLCERCRLSRRSDFRLNRMMSGRFHLAIPLFEPYAEVFTWV